MRINKHLVTADAYPEYKRRYSTKIQGRLVWKKGMELTKKQFCDISNAYFMKLNDRLLEGHNVKVPHDIGYFCVLKKKCQFAKRKVDYGHLKATGKIVYHTNIHSNGWYARFTWRRNKVLKNGKFYDFRPVRTTSRRLAQIMQEKEGHKRYFT